MLGPNAIETQVLGVIPPEKISAGTKSLLLMYFLPNKVFSARNSGDNCAHWIMRIGAKKNITINLHHMMDFGNGKFTIRIDNTGQLVHSMDELDCVAGDCLQGMYR